MMERTVRNAIVVPPDSPKMRQRTGVLTPEGVVVREAETMRFDTLMTLAPDRPKELGDRLSGRWLWGGTLYDHFGHFLVESQSRIWAARILEKAVDGVLFVPKRPRRGPDLVGFQRAIIDAWGIPPETVKLVLGSVEVEELAVVEQAIGLGKRIAGTEKMREAANRFFATDVAPEGPERLYVSRSRLSEEGGAVLLEKHLETYLEDQGFTVFHPQEHDIRTQIARYKSARQLIFCDGSAAHMFAYVGRPDQQVAVLLRRSFWSDGPIDHIRAFTGAAPLVLPVPIKEWLPRDGKGVRGASFVLHDLDAVGNALVSGGFTTEALPGLSTEEVEGLIMRRVPHDLFSLVDG